MITLLIFIVSTTILILGFRKKTIDWTLEKGIDGLFFAVCLISLFISVFIAVTFPVFIIQSDNLKDSKPIEEMTIEEVVDYNESIDFVKAFGAIYKNRINIEDYEKIELEIKE